MANPDSDEDNNTPPQDPGYASIHEALNFLSENAEQMMEYQHLITRVCLLQANNWHKVAEGFQLQQRRALANSEACAWIARKSAENVGDIITASYGLDDDDAYQADGEEDLDDED